MRAEPRPGVAVVLLSGALFTLAVLTELPHVNGPDYSRWPWRSLPLDRALMLFSGPLVFYAYLFRRWCATAELTRHAAAAIVAGLVACSIMFQYAAVHVDKRGRNLVTAIIMSPGATSYFTDAAAIEDLSAWLPEFANAQLNYHSKTHPPGPILYHYAFIKRFGIERAPLIAGTCIGLLASLGVAMLYVFGSLWVGDRSARIGPCFLYALMPGLIGFIPEFDQMYPLFAIAMMVFWARSLERTSSAIWLGLALFVASFMAYNLIVVGAFMAPFALLKLQREGWQRAALARCLAATAIALGVAVGVHVMLWAATSFHPWDSFQAALIAQRHFSSHLNRPWASVIVSDPYDFFLGSGLMTLPLLLLSLRGAEPTRETWKIDRWLTLLAILAIVVVDLSGLLRCEAARVWLFLQPLVIVPAGLQLARWSAADRGLVLALQALVVIAIRCKLLFLGV